MRSEAAVAGAKSKAGQSSHPFCALVSGRRPILAADKLKQLGRQQAQVFKVFEINRVHQGDLIGGPTRAWGRSYPFGSASHAVRAACLVQD